MAENSPDEMKMIRVSPATKDRLDNMGRKTETYNDVISRLLDEHESKQAAEAH